MPATRSFHKFIANFWGDARSKRPPDQGRSLRISTFAVLGVVLFSEDLAAFVAISALDPALFRLAHMAVAACQRFLVVDPRIAAFQVGNLVVGERAALNAFFDAPLLADVTAGRTMRQCAP